MVKISRPITRDEVAHRAGVSPSLVSYVVNNGPRPVAPETRKKILETIQKLGYKPNALARNLRLQHSSTIGLILPDIYNTYFAEVARGVEQMASENGLTMVLCHSDYKLERELHFVEVLQAERSAGVIWFPATNSAKPAEQMVKFGMPFVILDRIVPSVQAPTVVADNFHGAYLAVQHLIKLGHRLIGCITRPVDLYHSSERIRGYRAALNDNHIDINESLLISGGFRLDDGCAATKRLMMLSPHPTAIFAYNDFMAIGALRAAYELDIKVPGDLSLVGYDDIPLAAFTTPALTTVSQPKLEMGREGVSLLLEAMKDSILTNTISPYLPVRLIVRESTKSLSH